MKKLSCIILIFSILFSSNIYADEVNKYDEYAEKLSIIGVFQGTGDGFELNRAPTRLEGLIMLLRLLGKEQEIKASIVTESIFTDVPAWGIPYTNYAYENNLTSGIGDGKFGSNDLIQSKSYMTFLLRALGYDDRKGDFKWGTAIEFGLENNIISENMYFELTSSNFLRGHVAKLSYDALYCNLKDDSSTLLSYLISINSISAELAEKMNIVHENDSMNEHKINLSDLADSCVYIEVTLFDGSVATGSGFYISTDGQIVTNYHVIDGAKSISIKDNDATLYSGEVKILGYSKSDDIAILKINVTNKYPVDIANSDNISFGEKIYAIGSPKGLQNTVSEGLVSSIRENDIQISAAISHGSSGGALFNEQGKVIGITYSGIESGENLGFAIPINKLQLVDKNNSYTLLELFAKVNEKGIVTEKYDNGDVYIGELLNEQKHGYGTYIWADGDKYEGSWEYGDFHGWGTYSFSDGDKYEGSWENNNYNGWGTYTYANGNKYEGEYLNDYRHGLGKITNINGYTYLGSFYHNEYDGFGTEYFTDGSKYSGMFYNSMWNGDGTYTYSDLSTLNGSWKDNEFYSSQFGLVSSPAAFYTYIDYSEVNLNKNLLFKLGDGRMCEQVSDLSEYLNIDYPLACLYRNGREYKLSIVGFNNVIEVIMIE